MDQRKQELLHILQDLRGTPERARRSRLQKLTKAILVQVAEVMLRKWERERERLQAELSQRDFHIERLEAMLEPKSGKRRKDQRSKSDD